MEEINSYSIERIIYAKLARHRNKSLPKLIKSQHTVSSLEDSSKNFFEVLFSIKISSIVALMNSKLRPKLYIPNSLNIDPILWHSQLCALNVKSWFKSSLYPVPYIELYCIVLAY